MQEKDTVGAIPPQTAGESSHATGAEAPEDARPLGTRLLGRLVPTTATVDNGVIDLGRAARHRAFIGRIGVPIMAVALIAFFTLTAENFLTGSNVKDILAQAALPMIVAVGLTVCLAMGEFDLSLNGVAGLATVMLAVFVTRDGMATIPAIALVLLAGAGVGALNGVLVGYVGVSALIVTIAVNSILDGWQFVASGSEQIFGGFPPGLVDFARGEIVFVPTLAVLAGVIAVLAWALLERTTLGRHIRAVGGNPEAARIAGVSVARIKVAGFVICAALAALAGLMFAARETSAYPLGGLDVLLSSFAACFIGAAMFKLGEFNVPGTVVGVMIATITSNGLILLNVPTYATYFFQGTIVLVALLFARAVAGTRSAA